MAGDDVGSASHGNPEVRKAPARGLRLCRKTGWHPSRSRCRARVLRGAIWGHPGIHLPRRQECRRLGHPLPGKGIASSSSRSARKPWPIISVRPHVFHMTPPFGLGFSRIAGRRVSRCGQTNASQSLQGQAGCPLCRMRRWQILVAKIGPKRCHQNRMISADVLKLRNGPCLVIRRRQATSLTRLNPGVLLLWQRLPHWCGVGNPLSDAEY